MDPNTPRTTPRKSHTFDDYTLSEIRRAATTGIYDIRGAGAKRKLPHFDDLLFLGASISRYPLEGYREKCGTNVVLGTRFAKKPIELKIPITIAGMSFGSLSAQAKEALGRGASIAGTSTTTGDGGMTPEERGHSKTLVYQYLPSRYGMNPDDLRKADAIEVVVGQGAKPGGGGMLLGQKISDRVAEMRCLPKGIDQRSACRHPDWTGPDDLEIKIHELREITDWEKPIYVKVGGARPYYDTRAGGEVGRRRRSWSTACRAAPRRRRKCSSSMSASRRSPASGRRCRRCRNSACIARCSSSSRAASAMAPMSPRRWRSAPMRCRSAPRRWWRSATTIRISKRNTRSSAPRPAPMTTGMRAAIRPASPRRIRNWPSGSIPVLAGRRLANYLKVMTLEAQTIARACGKIPCPQSRAGGPCGADRRGGGDGAGAARRHGLDSGQRCGVSRITKIKWSFEPTPALLVLEPTNGTNEEHRDAKVTTTGREWRLFLPNLVGTLQLSGEFMELSALAIFAAHCSSRPARRGPASQRLSRGW